MLLVGKKGKQTHRRIPFKSALAYKRRIDAERKAALAELVAYDQELGI